MDGKPGLLGENPGLWKLHLDIQGLFADCSSNCD